MMRSTALTTFTLSLLLAGPALAGGVDVKLSFEGTDILSSELIAGQVVAEVINVAGEEISNISLRPGADAQFAAGFDRLEFASLTDGESRSAQAFIHAPDAFYDESGVSTWELEYDTAGGETHLETLTIDHQP